jgi:hypothetical protein
MSEQQTDARRPNPTGDHDDAPEPDAILALRERREIAARVAHWAATSRPAAYYTELSDLRSWRSGGGVRMTETTFANEKVSAGYLANDATYTCQVRIGAAAGNEQIAGPLEIKAADGSYAGALDEIDGLISALLVLRGAIEERADIEPRRHGQGQR